jgi:hypothetical protein
VTYQKLLAECARKPLMPKAACGALPIGPPGPMRADLVDGSAKRN